MTISVKEMIGLLQELPDEANVVWAERDENEQCDWMGADGFIYSGQPTVTIRIQLPKYTRTQGFGA